MPCECKAGTGILELWGELREIAAGYAEQCGGAYLLILMCGSHRTLGW